jgi:hypothetical protein
MTEVYNRMFVTRQRKLRLKKADLLNELAADV